MWKAFKVTQILFHILSVAFLMAAIALNITALVTPRWHVSVFEEKQRILLQGLWEDCYYAKQPIGPSDWLCKVKTFDQESGDSNTPKISEWQLSVTILLAISGGLGLLALILGFVLTSIHCSTGKTIIRTLAIVWFSLEFLATLCCAGGVIIFMRKSYEVVVRKFFKISANADEQLGLSYWLAVSGALCYAVSMLLSLISTILIFVLAQRRSMPKTWPRHNNIII